MPVSLVDASDFGSAELSRYNTIVLPSGGYSERTTNALLSWTRGGGTLIVLAGGASWASETGLIDVEVIAVDYEPLTAGLPYHLLDEARGAQAIGGSIFEVDLDTTHPVGYGLNPKLPVFYDNSSLYSYTGSQGGLLGAFSSTPLLSGYLSKERLAQLPGAAGVIATRSGRGHVIVLMNEINHRAYWMGTQRLFFNAIFFGSSY
jgi:hypothetical protein